MSGLDVVVVGGGPAGSTAATLLARQGLAVTLLERERFPRDHIGESLLPASMPILDALGVLPQLEAGGYLEKWGATMVWGASSEPWSWHFRETNTQFPHAYQVWRPAFDQMLLENAAASGAAVREGHTVLGVVFDGDRATGVRFAENGGPEQRLEARHIVDASGQAGLIGRALGLRQIDAHFRNLAVYAYYEGAERLPEPDDTNIFIEAFEHGWFWSIPLHTGWMSVGAVVDARYGQDGIARLGKAAFFDEQIEAAPRTKSMLRHARCVREPGVIRDWSYVSDRVVGPGWILCGDAACFIDPLFSTGVHLALSSGLMAAAYVTTALSDGELAEAAAPVYQRLYSQQYSHFRELARLFYASNRTVESYFWEVRRVLRDDSLTPREAFVRATAGQSIKGYERVVLERGELPPDFVDALRAVEAEQADRARRAQQLLTAAQAGELVPVLATGTRVERAAVLAAGAFAWGHALSVPHRPDGVEVSGVIRRLVELCDGRRTVADLVAALAAGAAPSAEAVMRTVVQALRILYVDGVVSEASGNALPERSAMTGVILQISVSNGGVPKHAIERGIVWEEGLQGDRQADLRAHGGPARALCLYSLEVIEKLREEGHPIGPGVTGDNVTVGALDWSLVVPGVEMRLGNEVLLEITGYAAPCWKNAQWFRDGDVQRMSQARHPGESRVYARVLNGGEIRVGDPVQLIPLDAAARTAKQQPHTYRWPRDFS